ncbi:cytochrome ubiquinol oxidase subunit II [Thioclava sp. JM3]|uniref:cytochrome ubiquinol oxidase subunit II n=1 Tax=Thioclava sp. JM3 TaxID=1973004 RepID=UPI001F0B6F24|nr:cytochrome ubiquinol oxidase subunit II [Thioclava sp. JM3]
MFAVLPVLVIVPIIIWRYRYDNCSANYAPSWDESRLLDFVMWGVPFAIVAFAGTLLWRSTLAFDPYRPIEPASEATRVQVVGLDWKWLFIYPGQGIATIGEMAFPASRPLALELTSDTVMQSFMIGALGGQIYAMPGMRTRLHLSADGPGSFAGENMQYNGEGFHTQKFRASAMADADFESWLQAARQVAIPLDQRAYSTLAERGTKDELRAAFPTAVMAGDVVVFSLDDFTLFDNVLARYRGYQAVSPELQPGSALYQPGTSSGGRP